MKYGYVPRVSRMNGRARDTNEGNRRHFTMSFLKSSVSLDAGSRASKSPPRGLGQHRVTLICSGKGVLLVEQKSAARRSAVPSSIYRLERVHQWIGSLDFGARRHISKFTPFDARCDGADRVRAGV